MFVINCDKGLLQIATRGYYKLRQGVITIATRAYYILRQGVIILRQLTLLQIATGCYYKLRQVRLYKLRQVSLLISTGFTNCNNVNIANTDEQYLSVEFISLKEE